MSNLPLHTEIIIWFILLSTAACMLLPFGGWIWRRCTHALPPIPQFPGSTFPHIFAYFYTAFFISTFAMGAIASAKMPSGTPVDVMDCVTSIIVQILLYLPFIIVYFTLPKRDTPVVSFGHKLLWLIAALAVVGSTGFILDVTGFSKWLIDITGCPENQDVIETLSKGSNAEKLIVAVMAVFVAPVTEECCFRGFLYNILKRWNTPVLATIFSALMFSSVHGSLAQAIPLFVFGVVQCIAYEKARSLWLPIMIHFIFNALNVAGVLLFMQA